MSDQARQVVKIAINQYVRWLLDVSHGYSSQCPMFAKSVASRDRICRSQIPKGVDDIPKLVKHLIQARDISTKTHYSQLIDAAIMWYSSDYEGRHTTAKALNLHYIAYKTRAMRGAKWLEYYFIKHDIT